MDEAEISDEPPTALAEESFENAAPVDLASVRFDHEPARDQPARVLRPTPALDEVMKKIPEPTRRALDELFRARFTTVRRISPEQLR